jgi:hypothetical protein
VARSSEFEYLFEVVVPQQAGIERESVVDLDDVLRDSEIVGNLRQGHLSRIRDAGHGWS